MSQRPNILFLLSDQQRYDTLGCVNPLIKTPALDRLAREGMHANRVYPPTPVCLPCRTALVTGQYPSTLGSTHNHTRLPEDYSRTVAGAFARHGYYTHMIGKSHLSSCHDPLSRESKPHIDNRDYFRGWHGPWYGFERADLAIGHSTEAHACGMHYGQWLVDQGVDVERYFGQTSYTDWGAWGLPEEFHNSKWTADRVIEGLERSVAQGRPFYMWANFQDPHNPYLVPEPWASMYKPEDMPAYGFKPGEPECIKDKPPFYREIFNESGAYNNHFSDPDLANGDVSYLAFDDRQVRENAACYYGMVSLMDHHIGRILSKLDDLGLADNTLVVFSSDHGDLLGDHGLYWKGFFAYEECQRVPFLARYPGKIAAGSRTEALLNLIDLPPTFMNLAGLPRPRFFEGVDQTALLTGAAQAVREDTVIEVRPGDRWNQRTLITPEHKLVFYANREYGELYDTARDPHQIKNLWADPSAQGLKARLIQRLLSLEMNRIPPSLMHSQAAKAGEALF